MERCVCVSHCVCLPSLKPCISSDVRAIPSDGPHACGCVSIRIACESKSYLNANSSLNAAAAVAAFFILSFIRTKRHTLFSIESVSTVVVVVVVGMPLSHSFARCPHCVSLLMCDVSNERKENYSITTTQPHTAIAVFRISWLCLHRNAKFHRIQIYKPATENLFLRVLVAILTEHSHVCNEW